MKEASGREQDSLDIPQLRDRHFAWEGVENFRLEPPRGIVVVLLHTPDLRITSPRNRTRCARSAQRL